MEERWLTIVDPWKPYASFSYLPLTPVNHFSGFAAGSGKSVFWYAVFRTLKRIQLILSLSSTIIEHIKHVRETESVLIAFYYFDFKDIAKRDLRGLLSSLLMQLADDSVRCWDVLHQLYAKCRNGSDQPSDSALAQCLRNMLELPGQPPLYIILDALDECSNATGSPSPRKKVLDFVKDLVECQLPNLYVCITSRPEQDIQTTLNSLTPTSRRVSLHEESGQEKDINDYIRSFVSSDEAMRRWRDVDKELVINTLSERAGGM
jgi:hypothetical protein